ncbi:MAG: metallophosphoesterase family protein [Anaerolineae bacterium]|nr:metallophosphoesterase family protein [Anaerolineae bacterium]
MRAAILSDVHANLPAWEAVLADIDRRQVDAVYCLGDIVGYAPWPNEVVEAILSRHIPVIAGNYDLGVAANSDDCGCAYKTDREKELGAQSIAFTNAAVTDQVRAYLRRLPRRLRITLGDESAPFDVLLVHGSPRRVNEYLFEDRPDASLLRLMGEYGADVMVFGHTHKPYHKVLAYEVDGETRYRHAINDGSVGKPKDGDSRACYLLIEVVAPDAGNADSVRAEFVRVPYDVQRAANAIVDSPLPDEFAAMLHQAR